MKGDSAFDKPGSYGTVGVSAPSNNPSARYEPAQWTDASGNLWMFGGGIVTGALINKAYNDLWKYDPSLNEWIWISGDNIADQLAVYGTKSVSSSLNKPGAKLGGIVTWVDNNGNLWMFGGLRKSPYGASNELWKYNITLNEWTWVSGDNTLNRKGIYGTKGISSSTNKPGSRGKTTCSWVDNNGDLWMFGGLVYDADSVLGELNDLWKYNIASDEWTWVNGDSVVKQKGVYGVKGIAAINNKPGARYVSASWKDLNGNLWLFGGRGFDKDSAYGNLNDLWKYDVVSDQWSWISGDKIINQTGVYGSRCIATSLNVPGARMGGHSNRVDDCGNFWLFGGLKEGVGIFNDLWKYNVAANEWTWVSGDNIPNQSGVYGALSIASLTNKPGSRTGAVTWGNKDGFWVFGGIVSGNKKFNDLWKFIPDKPLPDFLLPLPGCGPYAASFNNGSSMGCDNIKAYEWNFSDPVSGANNSSSLINPAHLFQQSGTYTVKLVVTGCSGSKDSIEKILNVKSLPVISITGDTVLCKGETTLLSASGGIVYSWNTGSSASSISVSPNTDTSYGVIVSDLNCTGKDSIHVKVNALPVVYAGADTTIIKGKSIQLFCSQSGTFLWSPSSGLSCATCCNTVVAPEETTAYVIMITDTNGCVNFDTLIVNVDQEKDSGIFIPNVFSPNNDGQNDILFVKANDIKTILFIIYNKWGEKIFETDDINIGWNGYYKNRPMDTGVFIYQFTATLNNSEVFFQKGNVTLVR